MKADKISLRFVCHSAYWVRTVGSHSMLKLKNFNVRGNEIWVDGVINVFYYIPELCVSVWKICSTQ